MFITTITKYRFSNGDLIGVLFSLYKSQKQNQSSNCIRLHTCPSDFIHVHFRNHIEGDVRNIQFWKTTPSSCPRTTTSVAFSKANLNLSLMWEMTLLYCSPLFLEINSANRLFRRWHSRPIPPDVIKASGVKFALSLFRIRSL